MRSGHGRSLSVRRDRAPLISRSVGYSLIFDNRNGIRATRGQRVVLSQDFAGLGGDVKYVRTRVDATKYFPLPAGFVLSVHGEAAISTRCRSTPGAGRDADPPHRPLLRGADARFRHSRHRPAGRARALRNAHARSSPKATRSRMRSAAGPITWAGSSSKFPVSANMRSLGLRPSAFVDIGSVWSLTKPI